VTTGEIRGISGGREVSAAYFGTYASFIGIRRTQERGAEIRIDVSPSP